MKIKLNKFERVAGLFVLTAMVGSLAATAGIAMQKGWFATKVEYSTTLLTAGGVHNGTPVLIAGLRAGEVDSVDLISANQVKVKFKVFQRFYRRIRKDSVVQVVRPFVIGEKVLEISVGSETQPQMVAKSEIPSQETMDIMDLVSGRKLGPFMETMGGLASTLKTLADAFADQRRTQALVRIFDQLNPLLDNLIVITDAAKKNKRIDKLMHNLTGVTGDLNHILPQMRESSPQIGQQISHLINNLQSLTVEFQKLTPTITALAPELPTAGLRGVEALNEAVVLLKAMQKSFFLSGNVEEVLEEERRLKEQYQRKPASH